MQRIPRIAILALIGLLVLPVAAIAGTRIEKKLDLSSGGTFRLDTDAGSVTISWETIAPLAGSRMPNPGSDVLT